MQVRFGIAAVALTAMLATSAYAGDHHQAKWNQPQPRYSGVKLKPLTGQIDYTSTEGEIDDYDLQGLSGRSDSNRFEGRAGSNALEGRAGNNRWQAGADQKQFRQNASMPQFNTRLPKYGQSPPLKSSINRTRLPGDLSDKELTVLKLHDVVIMQDRSSSMGEDEHVMSPMGWRKMSRWDWCLEQAASLTRQTDNIPNWKMTVVLFSGKYNVFPNVTMSQLPYIYNRQGIYVGTKLANPLAEQISQYFQRRASGRARPLAIAVVTDGKPQDDEDLRDLIIQTTHQMRDPKEISITFLQVGNSEEGQKKLYKLDQRLVQRGAKYDIINVKPFYELVQTGLPKALVNSIQS